VPAVVPHREERARRDQALVERRPEIVGVDLADEIALHPGRPVAPPRHATHQVRARRPVAQPRGEQRKPLREVGAVAPTEPGQLGQASGDGNPFPVVAQQLQPRESPTDGGIRRERRAGGETLEGGVEHEEPLEDRGPEGLAGPVETRLAVVDEVLCDLPVRQGRHHGRRKDGGPDEEEQEAAAEPAPQRSRVARQIHWKIRG
jgi:hypothetical protein